MATLILAAWAASTSQRSHAEEGSRFPRVTLSGQVVGEDGKPVGGAMVLYHDRGIERRSRAGNDGEFAIAIRDKFPFLSNTYRISLLATSDDGRMGLFEAGGLKELGPVRVVVKAPRTVRVRVIDGEGRPVGGASVHATAGQIGAFEGRTGEDGALSFPLPADAIRVTVAAKKAGAGFAYEENRPWADPGKEDRPLPDPVVLTLDGARPPLRIRAIDSQGSPLPFLDVSLSSIKIPGTRSPVFLGVFGVFQTDRDGLASIDWLPASIEGTLFMITVSEEHQQVEMKSWPASTQNVVTIAHHRPGHLSGRVLTRSGMPAAGIRVTSQGYGKGASPRFGSSTAAFTGPDGRYSMLAHSDLAYAVLAQGDGGIALSEKALSVHPGGRTEVPDLTLGKGTWLTGLVTMGRATSPAAGQRINAWIECGPIPDDVRPPEIKPDRQVRLGFADSTDAGGRYRILLAPGKYDLRGPGSVPIETITIPAENPPAEFLRDYNLP